MINELTVEKLCRICNPELMGGSDSSQISSLKTIIGQERAVRALQFGLGIKEKGFNIFVAGQPGTGRLTSIERFLEDIAVKEPAPWDWCYVHNFRDSYRPQALKFPAGRAAAFQVHMENLIVTVVKDIRSAFESEEYAAKREELVKSFQTQKQSLLEQVSELAHTQNFAISQTQEGLAVIPLFNGKPISEEQFLALGPDEKEIISQNQEKIQENLEAAIRQAKGLDKSAIEMLQKLDQQVALSAIKHPISDIKEQYQDLAEILAYIEQVEQNILENLDIFHPETEGQPASQAVLSPQVPFTRGKDQPLRKYEVNVLVDNAVYISSEHQAAPVVLERNPTYNNLFGKIEQEAQFGALTTDFTLIRAGSLHKANGGYLVLPVEELINNPLSWDSLKRALANKELIIEDASDKLGMVSTKNMRPEPIPLNVKVILVGRPEIYQTLLSYDEHFSELFKVKADFDTQMARTEEHIRDYAAFISKICQEENLKHLDSAAMARIVEHGSRQADDQEKLSTHFGEIADVIREASYYASLENAPLVTVTHIKKALNERFYRSSQVQERIREMMVRGTIKIEVDGEKCGQVNGLSVISLGDISFGQPSRITVSIGPGREGLIDIERQSNLGGPLHTKGVLILSGYLTDKYAQDRPLSLAARLVFEQSYSGVDGDSASSTELYAILSALSGLPIRQSIAVTGSVNQMGEVQAIGGVNEKIEGYFDVCQAKGLTGKQGVMIPESNVPNLMLKEEVVSAVRQGQFHVWPCPSIDEGIEILTGVRAGERLETGGFAADTVNGRVEKRLKELADRLAAFYCKSGNNETEER